MTIEFRILGSVEVVLDGHASSVPGLKPKQLLAALVLSPNTLVATQRLIDALWPTNPPRSAHENLRTYATAIRRCFMAPNGQLRSQQRAFLIIAIVALFIAAVGMLNIGLASVAERARELVIRRAVGATRAAILAQMLLAALITGLIAALAAIAVAVAAVEVWVPGRIDPASAMQPPTFPWTAAGWGLLAAALTTLVGAAIPALVAARLDVAAALRD